MGASESQSEQGRILCVRNHVARPAARVATRCDDVDAATSNLLVRHLHRLAHLILQGTQRSKGFLGMWRHLFRTGPVNSMRRGDDDDADGPLLDLEATVLFTGLLEVKSRLLAVSVFMAGLSSRTSSLLLCGVPSLPFLRLVRS